MAKRGKPARSAGEVFWDKPPLMNFVADLLLLFAFVALAYGATRMFLRLPVFPVRELAVTTQVSEVTPEQIEYATLMAVKGNFFSVDLDAVRAAFEKLPWVRRAQVRRQWPARIEIAIEEHVAAARWKQGEGADSRLVNDRGEVFAAATNAQLPLFAGPEGSAMQVMGRYREFSALLAPLGRKPQAIALSPREAWQVRLDDGVLVELGREQARVPLAHRMTRFVSVYREAIEKVQSPAVLVDLRYPNGFALRPAGDGEEKQRAAGRPAGEQGTSSARSGAQGPDKKGKQ